ncbi:J domain-containing protein [Jiella sp. MQZ9-1]|uniref:DnaJ domain-containing protein n=1 Tax=Jiella flava TaxID=2816857 RepID=A0A939FXB4_9HYPH|nr:DnaJ domain-containing protein [Jiella flava]MBO0663713.1 DnaJ domain-containing protein [Jiella flava]MCD2472287.1 J domain-containing protein [Jiella flava]
MKLDSKYFDGIRVKGKSSARAKPKAPVCAWDGCDQPGLHKAPLGRDFEGQYLNFCVDHVRQYNKSYNYFSGLSDDAIQKYLKDAMTGHRPTWSMGRNGSTQSAARSGRSSASGRPRDPFGLFGEDGARQAESRRPKVRPLEKKAFENLGLEPGAPGEAIRRRYKDLVKQLHPDANGGDRGHEDRLREVIQAYKLLKQAGLC